AALAPPDLRPRALGSGLRSAAPTAAALATGAVTWHSGLMPRWSRLAVIYALLGLAAGSVALIWRGTPWDHPEPWLQLSPAAAHLYSALLGLTVGLGVAMMTRPLVGRFEWARRLSDELRPVARLLTPSGILVV